MPLSLRMAELALDVVEQILVTLDAVDLVRCKSVCKSWLSLISSPLFVKAHFNLTVLKKYKSIDKRIIMHNGCHQSLDGSFICNDYHIIGSSNGLVCISPRDFELLVINPLTRVVNYLPNLPDEILPDKTIGRFVAKPCWGFGYDLSTDEYKVVVGFGVGGHRTRFHVLTLKSNVWKVIGDIKYEMEFKEVARPGVLCEGSLHWFMNDRRNKRAVISFDLSLEEFKEIPQPDDLFKEKIPHPTHTVEMTRFVYM
ncbi:F-box/kelch-repeat protein-like protein isoform X1 [Tanacetum coccineum]